MNLPLDGLRKFLEEKSHQYNSPAFIETDPISIPHIFSRKEDIEIAGFLTATISWGQRPTILRNARMLVQWMDEAPYEFIQDVAAHDLERFHAFVHRTFNGTDCVYFIQALQHIYRNHGGLENVFRTGLEKSGGELGAAIWYFRDVFFSISHPSRTRKHVADPLAGSSAKRICMFLRWMVRKDHAGVDFGIWKSIPASVLCAPLDLHSGNTARKLGLLTRNQDDWKAVTELTGHLRTFDPEDPVKYDYALYGLGVFEKF